MRDDLPALVTQLSAFTKQLLHQQIEAFLKALWAVLGTQSEPSKHKPTREHELRLAARLS